MSGDGSDLSHRHVRSVHGIETGIDAHLAPVAVVGAGTVPVEDELPAGHSSWLRAILTRLVRDPRSQVGLMMLGIIILLCILAPIAGRYDPNLPNMEILNGGPSGAHWLGTDDLGRDLWSRLLWGGRVSLPAGIEIVAISFFIGVPLGMLAGFGGRLIEEAIMRFIDLLLAVPGLLLAIAVVALLGTGMKSVVIGLGIASIPGYARVARASTLRLKSVDYVEASRSTGAGTIHILFRHILPNIVDPLVVLGTLNLSGAILAAAALSFLGVGTQLPDADWGTLLSAGYEHMFQSANEVIFPAIAIVATVLGVNLIGDALGDALDPRGRGR